MNLNQCPWCRKIKDLRTGKWDYQGAIILSKIEICPDCKKKLGGVKVGSKKVQSQIQN